MSAEIKAKYPTGSTLYVIILRASDGQVWNGSAFEALAAANWTTYAVTMTEQSTTGIYYGTMPSGISSSGVYHAWVFKRAGGSAATTDSLVGQQDLDWTGSADLGLYRVVDSSYRVDVGRWLGTAPLVLSSQKVQVHVATIAAGAIDAT